MAENLVQAFHDLIYELIIILKDPNLGEQTDTMETAVDIVVEMEKRLEAHHTYYGRHGPDLEKAKTRVEQKIQRKGEIQRIRGSLKELDARLKVLLDDKVDTNKFDREANQTKSVEGDDRQSDILSRKRRAGPTKDSNLGLAQETPKKRLKKEDKPKKKLEEGGKPMKKLNEGATSVKTEPTDRQESQGETKWVYCYACHYKWDFESEIGREALTCPLCKSAYGWILPPGEVMP